MSRPLPAALTIAGSDSGGGAGIQTDLRTFNAFKVYGCSAITAVTSQNPNEVRRIDTLSPEAVRCQLETVLDLLPVRWAKTGMLANNGIIESVAEIVRKYAIELVVDPVMVSTSGTALLEAAAVSAMKEKIFPLASWITPNIPEAELICQRKLDTPDDLAGAALQLYKQFNCNILLKSGHAAVYDQVTDIVCYQGKLFALSSPLAKISGNTAHGTGCTLSAAMAANFALGKSWQDVLISAKAFVYGALVESIQLTGTLFQMYPPEQDYCAEITLNEL